MYFKFFDTFSYNLDNKDYNFVDLFKRITFSNKTKNNKKIFTDYYVVDGDTAESIADEFYNDSSLGWFVLLCNDIIDKNEFPLSLDKVEKNAKERYPGSSFYFLEYIPDLQPGDVLIKCTVSGENIVSYDTSKYAIVQEYNTTFRYAIVKENVGLLKDDFVAVKRLNNNNVSDVFYDVILTENTSSVRRSFVQIDKITDAIQSPIEFLNSNSNYLSPYYINDQYESKSSAIGIYTPSVTSDVNTIRNTLLFSYIINNSSINLKTIFQQYVDNNNKKRIIKILKPIYAGQVFSAIQELLLDNSIRIKNVDIVG